MSQLYDNSQSRGNLYFLESLLNSLNTVPSPITFHYQYSFHQDISQFFMVSNLHRCSKKKYIFDHRCVPGGHWLVSINIPLVICTVSVEMNGTFPHSDEEDSKTGQTLIDTSWAGETHNPAYNHSVHHSYLVTETC